MIRRSHKPSQITCCIALTIVFSLILLSAPGLTAQAADTSAQDAAWLQEIAHWRMERAQQIDAPDGWLTLVGLDWLKSGSNSIGSSADNQIKLHGQAPDHLGSLVVGADGVRLQPPAQGFPTDLQLDGNPAAAGPLVTSGSKPSTIQWRSLSLQVLNRGGRFTLRTKDTAAPARTAFRGLYYYPPDAHFRVQATWTPYTPPHILKIPTAIGTTIDLPSPGVAEFTMYDKPIRLEPVIEDPQGKVLFFILRDQTHYDTTYETARYLHTGLPDHGLDQPGTIMLDFNKLENPPCAYSSYATCPLPPPDNRLLIQIQAGEKRYAH